MMASSQALDLAARLTGVLCATVTPFDPDTLEVDWGAVRSNAQRLISRGIRVIVVNGSIAEQPSLTEWEQTRAVRETVEAVGSDATVIAGCSHVNPRVSLRLCQEAMEGGAQGVMLLPPYYFRLSNEEVLDYFEWIGASLAAPLILYDNPATSRSELPPSTIAAIARLHNFAGLKAAIPDVMRFAALVDRFGPEFPVIAALEDPLLYMLVAGARGCMTASAAFAPELLAEIVAAVARGDLPAARAAHARLRAFRQLFSQAMREGRPAYIPYTKAAIDLVGWVAGPPRPPLRDLTAAEKEVLRTVLVGSVGLTLPAR